MERNLFFIHHNSTNNYTNNTHSNSNNCSNSNHHNHNNNNHNNNDNQNFQTTGIIQRNSTLNKLMCTASPITNWALILHRLQSHPENDACEMDGFGVTPLFHALRKKHIDTFNITPSTTTSINSHCTNCNNNNDTMTIFQQVIQTLIQYHPQSLHIQDTMYGHNALQVAIMNPTLSCHITQMILESNPDAVFHKCQSGRIALHYIGQNSSSSSVCITKLLLDLYPLGMNVKETTNGWLPLHDSCSNLYTPIEIISLLIQQGQIHDIGQSLLYTPSRSSSRSNSIHSTWNNYHDSKHHNNDENKFNDCNPTSSINDNILTPSRNNHATTNTKQVRYCGGLLVPDHYGSLPVNILFQRIMYSSNCTTTTTTNDDNNHKRNDFIIHDDAWEKICLVVKHTVYVLHSSQDTILSTYCTNPNHDHHHHHRDDDDSNNNNDYITTIPILHALIECNAHPKIVQYAIQRYAHLLFYSQSNFYHGSTPLSLAAQKVNTHPEMLNTLLNKENEVFFLPTTTSPTPTTNTTTTTTNMRSIQATAAIPDYNGRLPLHHAILNGRTWNNGISILVQACPDAVSTPDVLTRMYPFMLAAIPKYEWDNSCLYTIYELLRCCPYLLRYYS